MEDYSQWTVEELRGMIVGHDAVIWCLYRAMAALEGVRMATTCICTDIAGHDIMDAESKLMDGIRRAEDCRRDLIDALMMRPDGIERFLFPDNPMNGEARRAMSWLVRADPEGDSRRMMDDGM